ncbi:hypothetical protein VTO42DRAFT_4740 [Malbranchea cinnamomea]
MRVEQVVRLASSVLSMTQMTSGREQVLPSQKRQSTTKNAPRWRREQRKAQAAATIANHVERMKQGKIGSIVGRPLSPSFGTGPASFPRMTKPLVCLTNSREDCERAISSAPFTRHNVKISIISE